MMNQTPDDHTPISPEAQALAADILSRRGADAAQDLDTLWAEAEASPHFTDDLFEQLCCILLTD